LCLRRALTFNAQKRNIEDGTEQVTKGERLQRRAVLLALSHIAKGFDI
jgi:hypothetical protein